MKSRIIKAKEKNRNVCLVSLGSSTSLGIPFEHSLVYDVITREEMKSHNIPFKNVLDLKNLYQHASSVPTQDDNRHFVMETVRKVARRELSYAEMHSLLDARDIDKTNAINFFNENRNQQLQQQNDVYDLLKSFIRNNPHLDVFVDEFPILWNPKSKFSF